MTRPDSIRAVGLAKYLDSTKQQHNGKGYADFLEYVEFYDKVGESPPVYLLARAFGISRPTANKYLDIHREESRGTIHK